MTITFKRFFKCVQVLSIHDFPGIILYFLMLLADFLFHYRVTNKINFFIHFQLLGFGGQYNYWCKSTNGICAK